MNTPIRGILTNAGTMQVSGEENRTGIFIAMTVAELRAVSSLPMYREVTVIENENEPLRRLREAVQFVIDHAGKTHETELGDIHCNEFWMAEQLGAALDANGVKPPITPAEPQPRR